ncbi:uncharacterized protein LOC126402478 isoform X2 [Epinephelus moara]|uniref:uncharacterized protein LOC126402478 isoform X2 n=1 Tax=Epinephelus moara TaxID=300413 RepID=UPI00214E9BAE|nr:uncharacterized protein LOC126402478 isoform X2 [Epinephelus moara]
MRVSEVKEAVGNPDSGYLINVMDHKTVRKFGTAQIYLEPEEYRWFTRWLQLRNRSVPLNNYFFTSLGRAEAKDLVRYVRRAWSEMGLPGSPSLLDLRTAVSTYNFQQNDDEIRKNLSSFMCHSAETQERFYALHKTVQRAIQMRDMFVQLSLREEEAGPSSAASSSLAASSSSSAASSSAAASTSAAASSSSAASSSAAASTSASEGRVFSPKKPRLTTQALAKKVKEKVGFSPRKMDKARRALVMLKKI